MVVVVVVVEVVVSGILKASSNRTVYNVSLVQKMKHRVYKIHAFLNEANLCLDSASYFI